jgi:lipopolysaccharide/colanic/teichoic acid biosynthesis glycosyltransferase
VIIWITIPIIILLIKFIIKKYCKSINNIEINIIGTFYKFNDHEILILTNKGFTLFFYDSFQEFQKADKYINYSESINVINYNISQIERLEGYENILISDKCLTIDKFMELYLRKIFINYKNTTIGINAYRQSDFILKRLIDYSAILFFMPILFLFCILIFFIKIKNKINEPLFFIQKRYGLNKKIFNVYKIRTMISDSKEKGNTKKNDSRIYPFALILRKLRIDELPQIFNILFGDMHLVGPRAEWINLADQYSKNITNYDHRHIVRPGITGWAQIIHPYGVDESDARQKLMYDMYYIKHWSIWFEIEICIKTFMVILDKSGF